MFSHNLLNSFYSFRNQQLPLDKNKNQYSGIYSPIKPSGCNTDVFIKQTEFYTNNKLPFTGKNVDISKAFEGQYNGNFQDENERSTPENINILIKKIKEKGNQITTIRFINTKKELLNYCISENIQLEDINTVDNFILNLTLSDINLTPSGILKCIDIIEETGLDSQDAKILKTTIIPAAAYSVGGDNLLYAIELHSRYPEMTQEDCILSRKIGLDLNKNTVHQYLELKLQKIPLANDELMLCIKEGLEKKQIQSIVDYKQMCNSEISTRTVRKQGENSNIPIEFLVGYIIHKDTIFKLLELGYTDEKIAEYIHENPDYTMVLISLVKFEYSINEMLILDKKKEPEIKEIKLKLPIVKDETYLRKNLKAFSPYNETITRMTKKRKTKKEIAEEIASAKKYLGLIDTQGNIYKPYREIITKMVQEGKTTKEIEDTIGKNEKFVKNAKRFFGLTEIQEKGQVYEPYKEIITKMVQEGKTRKEIAEAIGKNEIFVASAKRFFGLTESKEKGKVYEPYREIIPKMVKDGKAYELYREIIPKMVKDGKAYEPYREIITKMVKDGKSNKEIAEAIGKDIDLFFLSENTLYNVSIGTNKDIADIMTSAMEFFLNYQLEDSNLPVIPQKQVKLELLDQVGEENGQYNIEDYNYIEDSGNLEFNNEDSNFAVKLKQLKLNSKSVLLIQNARNKNEKFIAYNGRLVKIPEIKNINPEQFESWGNLSPQKQSKILAKAACIFAFDLFDENNNCIIGQNCVDIKGKNDNEIEKYYTDLLTKLHKHSSATENIDKLGGKDACIEILKAIPQNSMLSINPYISGDESNMLYSIVSEWKSKEGTKWQLEIHSPNFKFPKDGANWTIRLSKKESENEKKYFRFLENGTYDFNGNLLDSNAHLQAQSPLNENSLLNNLDFTNIMSQLSTQIENENTIKEIKKALGVTNSKLNLEEIIDLCTANPQVYAQFKDIIDIYRQNLVKISL